MKNTMIIAIIGLVLYLAGYVFASIKKEKYAKVFAIASYALTGIGLLTFFLGGFFWCKEVYVGEKGWLSYLSLSFACLLLLAFGLLSVIKKRPNWLTSLLMGIAFLAGIAFLISMIALSQDAIMEGINSSSSSI